MNITRNYQKLEGQMDKMRDLSPLILRLVLAYGFFEPAWSKVQDVSSIGEWFESMELPLPYLQAWLVTLIECLGVILLSLGLATRLIAIPLIVTMVVAIYTVHWENGFSAGDNGFEIPFYYIVMLVSLLFTGGGRYSLDHLLLSKKAS